ncbi:AAA family ATPase [Paenibacillus campi]|uniref:AAA family ATPase n=1 Tax=Paenibacillus campi TaxID=3106031 RepID=UPI002B0001B2|nr:AAA family ATPase [Paenibacillus sp. SGZ-1014]
MHYAKPMGFICKNFGHIYDNNPNIWIIEEIEAHLHTELQLKIARFLFRLINKDKSIWITTHSDTLAQQINNLLTIAQRNDQTELLKKLNYSEQDIPADLNQIHAYQFEDIDGNTVITKLELGLYGFEMKTFNDTLEQLIKETNMIQNYEE